MPAKVKRRRSKPNGSSSLPEWLTLDQAVDLCSVLTGHSVARNTFRRHIMDKVRLRRLGGRVLVNKASVEEWWQQGQ